MLRRGAATWTSNYPDLPSRKSVGALLENLSQGPVAVGIQLQHLRSAAGRDQDLFHSLYEKKTGAGSGPLKLTRAAPSAPSANPAMTRIWTMELCSANSGVLAAGITRKEEAYRSRRQVQGGAPKRRCHAEPGYNSSALTADQCSGRPAASVPPSRACA